MIHQTKQHWIMLGWKQSHTGKKRWMVSSIFKYSANLCILLFKKKASEWIVRSPCNHLPLSSVSQISNIQGMWNSTQCNMSLRIQASIFSSSLPRDGSLKNYKAAVPRSSPQNLERLIRTILAKTTNNFIFSKKGREFHKTDLASKIMSLRRAQLNSTDSLWCGSKGEEALKGKLNHKIKDNLFTTHNYKEE